MGNEKSTTQQEAVATQEVDKNLAIIGQGMTSMIEKLGEPSQKSHAQRNPLNSLKKEEDRVTINLATRQWVCKQKHKIVYYKTGFKRVS